MLRRTVLRARNTPRQTRPLRHPRLVSRFHTGAEAPRHTTNPPLSITRLMDDATQTVAHVIIVAVVVVIVVVVLVLLVVLGAGEAAAHFLGPLRRILGSDQLRNSGLSRKRRSRGRRQSPGEEPRDFGPEVEPTGWRHGTRRAPTQRGAPGGVGPRQGARDPLLPRLAPPAWRNGIAFPRRGLLRLSSPSCGRVGAAPCASRIHIALGSNARARSKPRRLLRCLHRGESAALVGARGQTPTCACCFRRAPRCFLPQYPRRQDARETQEHRRHLRLSNHPCLVRHQHESSTPPISAPRALNAGVALARESGGESC